MAERNLSDEPKPSAMDWVHRFVKGGISGFPFVGGLAAELFDAILAAPLSRRRDEWLTSIAEDLQKLREQFETARAERLSTNESFITTFLNASQAAVRTHQTEKLEALRAAVLNSALPNAPDEDMQMIFLNLVDVFTAWHLCILTFFQDPSAWYHQHGLNRPKLSPGSAASVMEGAFPQLRGKREFVAHIVNDLHVRGLMSTPSLETAATGRDPFACRTTEMGKRFVQYITSPID